MGKGYINVTAIGALGKDPDVRATSSGTRVANFSIAVDQGYGENQKTEWVNVVVFDKLADLAEKFLKKGKTIALSGSLQTSSWDDKTSGQKRYKTEVVARDITFLDSGSRGGDNTSRTTTQAPRQQAAPQARATAPAEDAFISDDIPF